MRTSARIGTTSTPVAFGVLTSTLTGAASSDATGAAGVTLAAIVAVAPCFDVATRPIEETVPATFVSSGSWICTAAPSFNKATFVSETSMVTICSADVTPSTPEQLGVFVKAQLASWGKRIKDAGIEPE